MVQPSERLDARAVALGAVADPANAHAISALIDLMMVLRRSRLFTHEGAPATALLVHVCKHGPMRAADLAHAMRLDQSTVSRHLGNLVEHGLLERSPDPTDGRAHVMGVTAAGRRRAEQAIAERVGDLERVLAGWSRQDRSDFARLVGRFSTELESDLLQGART